MRTAWFAAMLAVVLAAALHAQQPGRVEGRVVSSNGEPVRKATVRLLAIAPSATAGTGLVDRAQRQFFVEITGSGGSFTIEGLPPGVYAAGAEKPGFTLGRSQSQLTIAPGENKRDVTIRMIPLAVISGKVVDADGDPVPGARVTVMRQSWNGVQRTFLQSQSVAVDDRGDYRIPNLEAGRYYLMAEESAAPRFASPQVEIRGRNASELNLPTFYPNETEPGRAQGIDAIAGSESSGTLIRLRRGRTYSIRGTLLNGATNAPATGTINIFHRDVPSRIRGTSSVGPGDSRFSFDNLVPGDYVIQMTPPLSANPQPGDLALSGRMEVSLGSQDIDGFVMRLMPGFDVTGRVILEGGDLAELLKAEGTSSIGGVPGINFTVPNASPWINLIPANDAPRGVRRGAINADGSFVVANVPAGIHTLSMGGAFDRAYIKAIRIAGRHFSGVPLDLSQGLPGTVEVVLAPNPAGVAIAGLPTASDTTVVAVLWPAVPRANEATLGVRSIALYTNGDSSIKGLPPGDYFIAAFEDVDPSIAHFYPVLNALRGRATPVTLSAGQATRVTPARISRQTVEAAIQTLP